MASRHEDLPTLPEDSVPENVIGADSDLQDQYPKPTTEISQWRLKKIIEATEGGVALADLAAMFQLEDPNDAKLQYGLGQLLRAGRVKRVIGASKKTGGIGTVFVITEKGRERSEIEDLGRVRGRTEAPRAAGRRPDGDGAGGWGQDGS